MALALKLLICLLLVASAHSTDPEILKNAEVTTKDPPGTTLDPPGTTKDPPGTTLDPPGTTLDPPGTTLDPPGTTKDPPGTTLDPPGTTKDPPGTTQDPPGTTQDPPGTTKDPPGTTKDPTGPTETPTEKPTPTAPGPCASNPCSGGSTCEERHVGYVCLCLAGDYYNEVLEQCILGKAFPGELEVSTKYDEKMADKTSELFRTTADAIVSKLKEVFGGTEAPKTISFATTDKKYITTIVNELSKQPNGEGVLATVEIIFDKDSTIKKDEVEETIAENNLGAFTSVGLCKSKACDEETTKCTEKDGTFICSCLDKYIPTNYTDRACVACPNGMKAAGASCKPCDFGYSGFNCEDNWQLILVIVGSVLGVLLLITTILLPVVALNSKKKIKKAKNNNYEKPAIKTPQFSNGLAAPQPTPIKPAMAGGMPGFGGNAVPRIPRATTNDNWDRNTNLEMVPSNSRQNLLPAGRSSRRFDDQEDVNPYNRQTKPQNNPYGMGRPQVNPYASNQGHSNPYYRH